MTMARDNVPVFSGRKNAPGSMVSMSLFHKYMEMGAFGRKKVAFTRLVMLFSDSDTLWSSCVSGGGWFTESIVSMCNGSWGDNQV